MLWAALPPVLYGLALCVLLLGFVPLSEVVIGGPTNYRGLSPTLATLVPPAILGAMLVGGALLGAWKRLPRWSYTWATGGVVAVLFALVLVGDELPHLILPTVDMLIVLGLLLVLAVVALVAARRGTLDAGLVGLGFGATFAVAVTFFATAAPFSRVDVGLLSTPAGLVFAALIVAFVRGGDALERAAMSFTAVLAAAVIWWYKSIVCAGMPSFSDVNFHWKLQGMAMVGLLGPSFISWLLALRRPAVVS